MNDIELTVGEFVALTNQTLEFAYSGVVITGELANFRISKNRWVYFDLKDDDAIVRFFGTVYMLPGPLEDGMLLKVRGTPRLHPQYGFSINIASIQAAGEGTIKKAAELLQAKLTAEGLLDPSRKRALPYPPRRIGLVTSAQSAAYADFMKILQARWQGIEIELCDVLVQGENAPQAIVEALAALNAHANPPETIVIIRGGGSAEDLAAFSTEQVARAVAGSRVPTLVAIGHEVDTSLAELVADMRASTPSNAAELLVPDKREVLAQLKAARKDMARLLTQRFKNERELLRAATTDLASLAGQRISRAQEKVSAQKSLLQALSPTAILERGYAIIRQNGQPLQRVAALKTDAIVEVQLHDGRFTAAPTEKNNGK